MTWRTLLQCCRPRNGQETLDARREGAVPRKRVSPKPIGDRLLTLREAAEVLRLNPRTVREYVSRGELEGRIIGGRWRFRSVDLDAFFENAPSEWDFAGKDNDGD